MATVYSSLFNSDFKAFMTYTTETTNTAYKVAVTNAGVYIDCSWANYPWKTTIAATGYDSRTASVGTTYWTKGNHGVLTADKTYSWERKTSAYTVTIKVTTKKNVSGGGSGSKSVTFTVPALAKYTVSYNANGGSDAPGSQTKYYGKTLTLSSTKPTRSGYTFVGWGTSTTDTAKNYDPGDSYTTNASDTLYAIWKKTITLSYSANNGSGAPSSQSATVYNATTSKTFTISSTKPTRTGYTFLGWSKSSTATSASYSAGGSITLSATDTLYAVWKINTWSVKYNENGGTNAPASQTKTYGTDLKLTTSKPSRTGYNFKGWATSSTGSVAYQPGGVYKTNGAITLYAVWERAIFTVSYNANGGSDAPVSQEKIHGTDLTLTSAVPTRKYHAFKGWATSASATSPTYSAGGTYTANADITLYAVWEVTYIIPRITSASVTRCDENGEPLDDGTHALVTFNWVSDEDVSRITIYWKASTETAYGNSETVEATGRSGSVIKKVSSGDLAEDFAYNFKIEVVDTTDRNAITRTIGAVLFPLDMLAGGKGVTLGEPAKEEGFNVNMVSKFKQNVNLEGSTFMANGKWFYGRNVDGKLRALITSNTSNQYTFGNGSYTNSEGSSSFDGNIVNIRSKGAINITSPTAGVTNRAYGVNKVLWTGTLYMKGTQTATLLEAISAQPHGVVLVWSYYEDGAGADQYWNYIFIPKWQATNNVGAGVSMFIVGSPHSASHVTSKYVHINDTTIKGYSGNSNTSVTQSNTSIIVKPASFVLRYIIGV